MEDKLLTIENLNVTFKAGDRLTPAVRNVSLFFEKGETLALVGESGSGKTTTGFALLKLNQSMGRIMFGKHSLNYLDKGRIRKLRNRYIFKK